MKTDDDLKELLKIPLWENFFKISQIPRESGNEKAIAAFLKTEAFKAGAKVFSDTKGNLVIKKNIEENQKQVVALQGHMDMVCQKSAESNHNFQKDPILPFLKTVNGKRYLQAKGTTLGADNGYALACGLTLLNEPSLQATSLELIFTVDEEEGLTGALNFDGGLSSADWIINLDSEEEGEFVIGCAGGKTLQATRAYNFFYLPQSQQHRYVALQIDVSGFKGGHSGVEINKNRGNAIIFLARLLNALPKSSYFLKSLNSVFRHNVIPSCSTAEIFLDKKYVQKFERVVKQFQNQILKKEEGARVKVFEVENSFCQLLVKRDQKEIIKLLAKLPYGVIALAKEDSGVVESSLNPSTIIIEEKCEVKVEISFRSLSDTKLTKIFEGIKKRFVKRGFTLEEFGAYPGWQPNYNSKLLHKMEAAWKDYFKAKPIKKVIHAGLECGVLGQKMRGKEFISIGPDIFDVHSINESIDIDSAERIYEFLVHFLALDVDSSK